MSKSRLALGAVQFGMKYGLNNARGKVPVQEVSQILKECRLAGFDLIDTAQSYGDSEAVLGFAEAEKQGYKFVTKVRIGKSASELLDVSFDRLKTKHIYGVLMHDCSELRRPEGVILYNDLIQLRNRGVFSKVGISVYSEQDLKFAIERFPVELVQLPFNILDQRFLKSGLLDKLYEEGVEVHARSVFLKGVLLKGWEKLPQFFQQFEGELSRYHKFCDEIGRSKIEASLGFVSSFPQISKIVVGVNGVEQLKDVVQSVKRFEASEIESASRLSVQNERLWNPQRWEI